MLSFRQYDFTNNAERLYLEAMFSSWYMEEFKNDYYEEIAQWYKDLHAKQYNFDKGDSVIPILFKTFAAGMVYGQDLAEDLLRLSDPDMQKWNEEAEQE